MTESIKSERNWSKWHERLHKTLKQNKTLLPVGSPLLLSISGGQDSMALLTLILDLQRIYKWKVHIWHGDHGWHKQSEQISKELGKWCETKQLSFWCTKTSKDEVPTENKAREWRYKHLINHAKTISNKYPSIPCNYVVTGHTGSDRAETFIMNLARGANIRGLSSLKESRKLDNEVKLIRPMLDFSRSETIKICHEMQVPIWIDPSNSDITFTRNRIRKEILPVLEKLHSGSTMRIARLSDRLGHLERDQYQITELAIEAIRQGSALSREKIIKLSLSARATIFSQWLEKNNAPNLSSIQLKELSQKISKGNAKGYLEISNQWKISWNKTSIDLLNTLNIKNKDEPISQQPKTDA